MTDDVAQVAGRPGAGELLKADMASEAASRPKQRRLRPIGRLAPFVYAVSDDHLGDLDVHGDLLDVFDVARLLRREAWRGAVRAAGRPPAGQRVAMSSDIREAAERSR